MSDSNPPLPQSLRAIQDDFLALGNADRLQLLLEFSDELPEVPEGMVPEDAWERVTECQSPVFIHVDSTKNEPVVYASAPAEAPTTRGFASILVQGFQGLTAEEIMAVPLDFPQSLGLEEAVSLLRLRGMAGMIWRIQRQISDASPA
ncbi:cysteine desulfuration protein SufE [Pontimonas salivibrio]|jgi:cysteine desulfuration protein SufE|uniref:Cysteine desulfuration protein SufE n=1 Tax=Pontimonas salivibrio TaxID=1159327 RepID=A0A2L2BQL1_9MICO|nr:SufE family protein [Pontimonas salivibrio]AVG23917.1 cysteine desulfuration protein SufE [Pontimonas salivibrio]